MKKIFLVFIILSVISCNEGRIKNINETQVGVQNNDDQTISEKDSEESIKIETVRKIIRFDTNPSGSFCYIDGKFVGLTPISLKLEEKQYTIIFERIRYYPKEIVVDISELEDNSDEIIFLAENKLFVDEYYLSYSSYLQADGIGKEFCRYVYGEDAGLIRIDSYVHVEKLGSYVITTNDKGQILTKQFHSDDGGHIGEIEKFEYNEEGLMVKSYYASDKVKWDCEYIYTDGILQKQISTSLKETSTFDYIVEIEYGSKYSEYTKVVTEKYFYPNLSNEERKEAIENDFMPRTIYTYQ